MGTLDWKRIRFTACSPSTGVSIENPPPDDHQDEQFTDSEGACFRFEISLTSTSHCIHIIVYETMSTEIQKSEESIGTGKLNSFGS